MSYTLVRKQPLEKVFNDESNERTTLRNPIFSIPVTSDATPHPVLQGEFTPAVAQVSYAGMKHQQWRVSLFTLQNKSMLLHTLAIIR